MPDTRYRKVTKADELSSMMLSRSDASRFRRKWLCPGEGLIAGYADSRLGKFRRAWVEFHLASCERCRLTVAYLVKALREGDSEIPSAALVHQAMGFERRPSLPMQWRWAAAGALAGIAILVVTPTLLHKTERTDKTALSTPTVPLIARSEPEPKPGNPVTETDAVRGPRRFHPVPMIISPRTGTIVATGRPEFNWEPVTGARRYEVQVVRLDGEPVWKGETDKPILQIPSVAALRNGTYFAWITAYLDNGQLSKSTLVRFQVER